jgi:hypothetical protein
MLLRPLVFCLAVAGSACAVAGLANESSPDGSMPAAPDAPGRGSNLGSNMGSNGSGSNTMSGTCAQAASGTIGTWDLSSASGSQTSSPGTSKPGATAGALTRSSDLTAVSGTGSINSNNWPAAATLDTTHGYYTFTITPPSGRTVSITGASITTAASSTGPAKIGIGTSADQFGHMTSLTSTTSPALSVSAATGTVELRVFGWASVGATGTLRISGQLTVTGSFQ